MNTCVKYVFIALVVVMVTILSLMQGGFLITDVVVVTNQQREVYYMTYEPRGRLGNRIFQMAALFATSRIVNKVPVLARTSPLRRTFDIDDMMVIDYSQFEPNSTHHGIGSASIYHQSIYDVRNVTDNVTLVGSFQSWKYFIRFESEFRTFLKFQPSLTDEASVVLEAIRAEVFPLSNSSSAVTRREVVYVGVHVRHWEDHKRRNLTREGFVEPDLAYYSRAMALFNSIFPNKQVVFITSSNNITRTSYEFANIANVTIRYMSPENSPSLDLAVLSMCNHSIISVGTFSWWAGFLANGMTVYYENYPRPGSSLAGRFSRYDYYMPHWIPLNISKPVEYDRNLQPATTSRPQMAVRRTSKSSSLLQT